MTSPVVKILLLFLLLCGAALGSYAAELTVTKVEDTNDGVCDGDCSLREAVVAAAADDTVLFSPLFNTPQTITLTLGQINIDKNLTITGTGQNLVTISGNNASRIFDISGGASVNISGMTFRDGNVSGDNGGAIRVVAGTLTVSNATFTNNTVTDGNGGAISGFNNTTLTLSNLVVIGNSSLSGSVISGRNIDLRDSEVRQNTGGGVAAGGIGNVERCVISDNNGAGLGAQHLTITDSTISNNLDGGVRSGDSLSTMTIERCLIRGNSRDLPGGGVVSSGMTVIRDSKIINNAALGTGGGIANTGTFYVFDSLITENTTNFEAGGFPNGGGGIRNTIGQFFIINSTVDQNTAIVSSASGGGAYGRVGINSTGSIYLVNSTVADNSSSGGGGGVKKEPQATITFNNTIVYGNNSTGTSEEDVSGVVISNGINLIGNTFGSSGWIADDLLNVNPLLGPLTDNGGGTMTHALLPGSPAINAGNNSVAIDPQTQIPLTSDQRGFLRFYGATVDIGAYELQPEISGTITYGNKTGAPTPRFVSGVLLTGAGWLNVSATSLLDGSYTLGGFGAGSYTVTPSKTGGANGISSFDAGLIARHAAGITPLTGNQLIVADVSGNGTISSFDAGQTARYTAGLNGFGSSGTWIFIPANRMYSSVNSTITGEDFIALLMGDVSGNWMPIGDSVRAPKVR